MNSQNYDAGIILVLLQRFEKQRLPRMTEIMQRLEQGNTINEFDIAYLGQALHDLSLLFPYIDRHPEYEVLFSKVIHYYKSITDKALNNEKNNSGHLS